MDKNSFCLRFLRRPLFWRDALVIILCTIFWMMPCYAGIPAWWVTRNVVRTEVTDDVYGALNAGQLKHAVKQAVQEMNAKLQGGAGLDLNALVTEWNSEGALVDNFEMVNAGQLKSVLKKFYDRMNAVHGTTGYPWSATGSQDYFEAVNVGQLKKLLRVDVSLAWNQNLAQGFGTTAEAPITAPSGAFVNRNTVLAAADHHTRNPQFSLTARGSPTGLPPNAENIDNAPVATTPGEFKVGQDGSASYTIHLQGPKGVGNVEPGISLEYNSNGGDGVVGLGWSVGGISAISRGPATKDVDGFNDPMDFDDNDRFYLDGDRLICVLGTYGEDGSEYRTLREQFSRIRYTKTETSDSFTVETKAGLKMFFGTTVLSSVRSWQNGLPLEQGRLSWALDRVEDNFQNYWEVVYGDLGTGATGAEGRPYFPDYQPLAVRYTGRGTARPPMHELRFIYERRPDQTNGYSQGALVRKEKRLLGIEIATLNTVIRSYKLRYNLNASFQALRGERSRMEGIQEFAGPWSGAATPRLPETVFAWEEGVRSWGLDETRVGEDVSQTVNWGTIPVPFTENNKLRLEHRGSSNATVWPYFLSKGGQFVDMDGDGVSEILFNHRSAVWQNCWEPGQNYDGTLNEFRYLLKKSATVENEWDAFPLSTTTPVESVGPRGLSADLNSYSPSGIPVSSNPNNVTAFPYLTTAAGTPTGAFLMDLNQDGLPDIVSSGSFNEMFLRWGTRYNTFHPPGDRKVINAQGVWLNQNGSFVKETTGAWDFPRVPTEVISAGVVVTRPANTPTQDLSGINEVLAAAEFAKYNEYDMGWRNVDMDGDGDLDIIRAGQGLEASGWLPNAGSTPSATPTLLGSGALSAKGRQLCFGLRNNGPNAPAGQRWELMYPNEAPLADGSPDPETYLKSIWRLPLPLVGTNGKLDMGRRLIDMNGDGLPDFVAQQRRAAAYPQALWPTPNYNMYDIRVWLNRGEAGWEDGGTDWRLEGMMLGFGTEVIDKDYGRTLMDMNGDGLTDFVVSFTWTDGTYWYSQQAVMVNSGKGWVKANGIPVNFTSLCLPKPMFVNSTGYSTVPRSFSVADFSGDGRPEFIDSYAPLAAALPGGSGQKIGLTQFLDSSLSWSSSTVDRPNDDWNLPNELLANDTTSPMTQAEIDGDGINDLFRNKRTNNNLETEAWLRHGLAKAPRVKQITNGLGVPIVLSYGQLPALAAAKVNGLPDPMRRYRPTSGATGYPNVAGVPAATVVTDYTTFDGMENVDGSGGGSITTSYFYAGLRSHAVKGSLGFEKMETRTNRSPVRNETIYSQDAVGLDGGTIGYPIVACGYTSTSSEPFAPEGTRKTLSKVTTTYDRLEISTAGQETVGKRSFLIYADVVMNENWSPDGPSGYYLGKTTSNSDYYLTGPNAGLLWKQDVTQDQGTPGTAGDDTQSLTEHLYATPVATGSSWRIGQIQQTTAISKRSGTPDVSKTSSFTYYNWGNMAGMLSTETIDPSTNFAVTKKHFYDDSGNEIKTVTTAPGMLPVMSEMFYSEDDRFLVSSKNALGHASVTTYDPLRSLATSATLAFASPPPSIGQDSDLVNRSAQPEAPGSILQTSTLYDAWGTAKVTTAADGLKSVRFTQYFSHSSLPRALYYVYEQAEGSTPVVTYYDRYHTPLLVEKTGFNGEVIFQESTTKFLFDAQGRYTGAQKLSTQPYFAHEPPPPYAIEEQDVYGRKVRVTSADGSVSEVKYVGLQSFTYTLRGGSAVASENSRMRTHLRVVDQAERPLQVVDHAGNSVAFTYAADGQPLSATTSYVDNGSASTSASTTITTTYNAQRLKESVTDPNAGTSFTYYDSFGRAVMTRDALNKGTVTSFDILGRPVRMITGLDVTGIDYGPHQVASWIAQQSTTRIGETETIYTYDTAPGYGLGKLANLRFKEFERNGGGIITEMREVHENYVYDALGRSVSVNTLLRDQVAFDGTYSSSTSYDRLGRVKMVTDAGGYTRASIYNEHGFLSAVHELSAGGPMLWQGMSYDASGKLLLEHHGNGIGTQNRYHPTRGFLESSRTMRWASLNAAVQEYEMQLDDLGNVLWRREQRFEGASPVTRTETFGYDAVNRLTYSAVTGQTGQNFTFAANGNIASKSGIGTYAYAERGHGPHAVTSVTIGSETQRSYTYDAKGRMTTEHMGTNLGVLPLREIAYTSYDQPRFIQHWGAAALSSDQGVLEDGTTPWDQLCTLRFYFGPGLQRLIQTKHKGQMVTKVLSLGGFEIREVTGGASLTGPLIEREERSSFGNGTRVKRWTATNPTIPVLSYEFAAKDHLGSDHATFNGEGQLQSQRGHLKAGEVQKSERQSYDAWGARRDGVTWAPASGVGFSPPGSGSGNNTSEKLGSNLPRGYTGHEMLDDVGLIHMNGRLYDSALGRMCMADREVQAPDMVQNYNRYSYVLNNPLNATDPSGHNWFKKVIGIIIAVIIAVILVIVATYALGALLGQLGGATGVFGAVGTSTVPGTGAMGFLAGTSVGATSFLGVNATIVLAAAVGATWAAVNTTLQGGSSSQILKSAVIGAANGAVGAMVGGAMHALGDFASSALAGGSSPFGTALHVAAHGVSGGAMAEANGGSFRDGFIGGLAGAGMSGLAGKVFGGTNLYNPNSSSYASAGSIAGRTAIASVAGGLSSLATGGKFADGAYSAAFFHLFNSESTALARLGSLGKLKQERMDVYNERIRVAGHLDVDLKEVWLELDLIIERLTLMKEANGGVLSNDHVSTGSDTAFALGKREVGVAVRVHSSGNQIAEANSWELNYIGVGAAGQMRFGDFVTDHRRLGVVFAWGKWNNYSNPMYSGKVKWGTIGGHYARSVYRNGASLNLSPSERFSNFKSIMQRYNN